jgi:hypothetical protein
LATAFEGHLLGDNAYWPRGPKRDELAQQGVHVTAENVLAAYANVHYDKRTRQPYGSIDLFIEGITAEGKALRAKALERVLSPEDRAIASGASNAGYHYMGSGKIMAQIGKVFAEAMQEGAGRD